MPLDNRELRALSGEELRGKEDQLKRELFNLRFQAATGRIENVMKIRHAKRDIARVKTTLRQQALSGQVTSVGLGNLPK